MSTRFTFQLDASDERLALPHKLLLGHDPAETPAHVLLKLLGYLLFFRERLQIEPRLHDEDNPFQPDLLQLDYQMRAVLWVECGECSVDKLHRLAVKVPEAEIWVLKRTPAEMEQLVREMTRHGLRRDRYRLASFEPAFFDELESLLTIRNRVYWVHGRTDPAVLQFEFNGLWFDTEFQVVTF